MPLMRQTAEPGSDACIGEEGESVGVTKNAGGDPIQTSEEEVVQHPVNMEDDVIVRRVCPHIMPDAMRYCHIKHGQHAILADEVRARHDDTCRLVSLHSNGEHGMREARQHYAKECKAITTLVIMRISCKYLHGIPRAQHHGIDDAVIE